MTAAGSSQLEGGESRSRACVCQALGRRLQDGAAGLSCWQVPWPSCAPELCTVALRALHQPDSVTVICDLAAGAPPRITATCRAPPTAMMQACAVGKEVWRMMS